MPTKICEIEKNDFPNLLMSMEAWIDGKMKEINLEIDKKRKQLDLEIGTLVYSKEDISREIINNTGRIVEKIIQKTIPVVLKDALANKVRQEREDYMNFDIEKGGTISLYTFDNGKIDVHLDFVDSGTDSSLADMKKYLVSDINTWDTFYAKICTMSEREIKDLVNEVKSTFLVKEDPVKGFVFITTY